jgi:hypothetical protein
MNITLIRVWRYHSFREGVLKKYYKSHKLQNLKKRVRLGKSYTLVMSPLINARHLRGCVNT